MTIPQQIDHATAPDAIACRNAPALNATLTLADPAKRAPKTSPITPLNRNYTQPSSEAKS
jgi:hypothetical protein